MAKCFKAAFIGSHGVGKTTLCSGLAARLKARDVVLEVIHEVARRCPLPINEETGLASESWILHTQIAEEVIAAHRHPVVICDRSALDNYVYLLLASGGQEGLDELVAYWMKTYDLLIHVPVLERPAADGVRATDPEFQRAIDARLLRELRDHALEFLSLASIPRESWMDEAEKVVWSRLEPPQLKLL